MSKKQMFSRITLFAVLLSTIPGFTQSKEIIESKKPILQQTEPEIKAVKSFVNSNETSKFEKICDVLRDFSSPFKVILMIGGVAFYHYSSSKSLEALNKTIDDLNKNNQDLKNEILTCKYDIKHEISAKNLEVSKVISKVNSSLLLKSENFDKFFALLSCLDDQIMVDINKIFCKNKYSNKLNYIIGTYLSYHPSFFCRELFENFFFETTDKNLQTEYAGFLYFLSSLMFHQCKIYSGTSEIIILSDTTKKKVDDFINANESLHIAKIESDEKSITITTKNIPNRTTLKISLTSDKTNPFKIEFK